MKKIINLLIISTCLSTSGMLHAEGIVKWYLPESQKQNEEFLLYRLSYRGVLTFFAWKDLADIAIIAYNKRQRFNGQESCQLSLKLSTENFSIAELFSSQRFHWRTTISPDLSRVFLVEEINKNKANSHKVVWINKKEKTIEMYHKRKQVAVESDDDDFFDEEDSKNTAKPMVWEKDGKKQAPGFLVKEEKNEAGLNYLVYDKTLKIEKDEPIFDPLSLIYSVRWYDYSKKEKFGFTVSHKESFRKYHTHYLGREVIKVGNNEIDAIKIEIKRNMEDDESDEDYMVIWLSNDERRIPLQYVVDAKLGEIKLKINALNYENYRASDNCTVRKVEAKLTGTGGK